jgi:hypothetical protein
MICTRLEQLRGNRHTNGARKYVKKHTDTQT